MKEKNTVIGQSLTDSTKRIDHIGNRLDETNYKMQ